MQILRVSGCCPYLAANIPYKSVADDVGMQPLWSQTHDTGLAWTLGLIWALDLAPGAFLRPQSLLAPTCMESDYLGADHQSIQTTRSQ